MSDEVSGAEAPVESEVSEAVESSENNEESGDNGFYPGKFEDGEEQSEESAEASEEEVSEESEEESEEQVEVQAETEEELEEEIEQAIEDGASEEDVKNMVRSFVLKVDGKEFTKEIDLADEEAVKAELQKAYKGQLTMQEKAEQEKLFKQFLEGVQNDPFKLIKQLNPDFDPIDYSSKYFDELLKEQELTPEEKEAQERERKYQEAIEKAERLEREAEERKQAEENAKLTASFRNSIEEALESDDELRNDPQTISRVAYHMYEAAKKGIELEPKQVFDSVKKEIRDQFQKSAGMLKDQKLLSKYMGEDLSEALRRTRVEQAAKKVPSANAIKPVAKKKDAKKEEKPKMSLKDFMRGGGL